MASEKANAHAETIERAGGVPTQDPTAFEAPAQHVQELNEAQHLNLTWRSWLVVFVTCFAIMAQVFVVVAAGSVIAFIIRDLGDASIAGWIIREQYLSQSISTNMLTLHRGAFAHAKRAVSYCRQTQ